MVDSPLVYPGGKASIRNFICDAIPWNHTTWVDVFGGGASVTLHKPPSKVEIYNDLGFVSLFFAVLRDDTAGPILREKLKLSPMSEDEFQFCHRQWMYEPDPIEQLRMWYVQVLQCFTHEETGTGWIGVGKKVSMAKSYKNHIDTLDEVIDRFREVQITNRHFRDIFKLFDDEETLFYLDPPYLNTEGGDVEVGYLQAMTISEHRELLELAKTCKGQVMISGYTNPLYEKELDGWEFKTLTRQGMIKNNAQAAMDIITDRTEYLWLRRHTSTDSIVAKAPKPKVTVKNDEQFVTLWEAVGS